MVEVLWARGCLHVFRRRDSYPAGIAHSDIDHLAQHVQVVVVERGRVWDVRELEKHLFAVDIGSWLPP